MYVACYFFIFTYMVYPCFPILFGTISTIDEHLPFGFEVRSPSASACLLLDLLAIFSGLPLDTQLGDRTCHSYSYIIIRLKMIYQRDLFEHGAPPSLMIYHQFPQVNSNVMVSSPFVGFCGNTDILLVEISQYISD